MTDPAHRIVRGRRRLAWGAAPAVLVAACSSPAGSMEIPDGYQAYEEADHVTFAVPDHFEQTPSGEELIHLGYGTPDSQSFQMQAWPGLAFPLAVGDDESLGSEEFEVDGAREALRVDFVRHFDRNLQASLRVR